MRRRRSRTAASFLSSVLLVVLVGLAVWVIPRLQEDSDATPRSTSDDVGDTVEVIRVVDGDTIRVNIDGQDMPVRYIGIDTPETVDPNRPVGCFGQEASARNRELLEDQQIRLESDISDTDQYGRLLRYVWIGDQMVNEILLREGYAQVTTYPPDVKYVDRFLEAQREARDAERGLWATC